MAFCLWSFLTPFPSWNGVFLCFWTGVKNALISGLFRMGWGSLPKGSVFTFFTSKMLWLYVLSGGLVFVSLLSALFISSVHIPVSHIVQIMMEKGFGWGSTRGIEENIQSIIWEVRLPRVLLALFVGAALSLSGAAFQGLLRNPLADPFTIGVSSGAALGVVSVIFFQLTIFGGFTLPLFGMIGGLVILAVVFALTRLSNRSMAIETIILAGIIVSSFVSSLISLIVALSGEELRQILYWLMGSVGRRGWEDIRLLLPFFVSGSLLLLIHHRELNALAMGDETAHHLGVDVRRRRMVILFGASLLTGASVAVSGTIGFVGLVIPHLVRLVIGPNHRHLLPLSMLVGGAFLVYADLAARTVIAPQELPVGVITAIIGAPVFAVLLLRKR